MSGAIQLPGCPALDSILEHLSSSIVGDGVSDGEECDGWRIHRLSGGQNNEVYRLTGPQGDLVVKLTIRDERERAWREMSALRAIMALGEDLAPRPLLFDGDRYRQPLIVETFLDGPCHAAVPSSDAEWTSLLEHYARVGEVACTLPPAVLNASSASGARALVLEEVARLAPERRSVAVTDLAERLADRPCPDWQRPSMRLCRGDPSPRNFIRRHGVWASVDWENSGLGDLAFELGDLLAHPAYLDVPPARQQWLVDAYCLRTADPSAARRIAVYHEAMLVYWAARLSRLLDEAPRGLDARLVARAPDWRSLAMRNHRRYVELAEARLRRD